MSTSDLQPTVDAFHALARSSPWRWRTLHFRHRDEHEEVEAWLRRPGDVVVLTEDGRRHRVHEQPSRVHGSVTFRPDGLVAERRDRWIYDHDDPMWSNYAWVAMLNPVELSHHVDVANLRADVVAGRPAWRAELRALPGYEPRCGGNCCELLYSEAGLHADFADDLSRIPEERRGRRYPDAHDVALDVGTGVVVRLYPVGGERDAPWIEVDVLEVDTDLDAQFG